MRASQDDIDLVTLLGALKRSLPRILIATALAGGLTYGTLLMIPPTYKSVAQVILEPSQRGLLKPERSENATTELKVDETEVASQAEVMRSKDLLTKVAATEQLDQNPEFNPDIGPQSPVARLLWMLSNVPAGLDAKERAIFVLEQNIRVTEVPKTRVINVEAFSHDSALAARLANAVANAYLERNRASQVKTASDTTTLIGDNIAAVKKEAEAAEAALERFRAESGLLSGQNNITLNTQQLSDLNTQITVATAARTEAEARARIIREMIASGRVAGSADILRSPNMLQLFQQKIATERMIAELSATLLPAHPRMKQLGNELSITKKRLAEEASQVAAGIEGDVNVARARESALKASIEQLTQAKFKSSDAQAKLSSLERESQSKRATYEKLLQRLGEVRGQQDRAAVAAQASLNELAVPSRLVDSPKKGQLTLLACGATLLLGLFYVLSRELMRSAPAGGAGGGARRRPARQERRGPVAVPMSPAMARISGATALAAAATSAVRDGESLRCLITGESISADPLSAASGFARDLARSGAPVILIDLASPEQADPGLAALVEAKAALADIVQKTPGGWHRVAIGQGGPDVLAGASRESVEAVIAEMEQLYRFVILAAPRAEATAMLEKLEGNFGFGAICGAPTRNAATPIEQGFLGYDVEGLTSVWVEPEAAASRKSLRRIGGLLPAAG